jgi:hypothetical protein
VPDCEVAEKGVHRNIGLSGLFLIPRLLTFLLSILVRQSRDFINAFSRSDKASKSSLRVDDLQPGSTSIDSSS